MMDKNYPGSSKWRFAALRFVHSQDIREIRGPNAFKTRLKCMCHDIALSVKRQTCTWKRPDYYLSQQFTYEAFREGFFAEMFLMNVLSAFFCPECCFKWHHASWLQAYCKVSCWSNPKHRSALSENQEPFSLAVAGGGCVRGLRASIRAILISCTSFRRTCFRAFRQIST